jgi:hypothetical protein
MACLVVAGILGTGYLVGQIQGTPLVSAASKHAKANTLKSHAASSSTPHADGTVTAVNGNTITVKADNDPAGSTEYTKVTTIVLTNATAYKGSTTKASLVVGAYVVAEGTVSSDGTTLTATSAGIGGPGGGHGGPHGGPHADGTVTAVNGNTITVQADTDPAGSTEYTKVTTILLTDTTTYDGATTKASIVVGSKIDADGTLSADGTTLTATHVGVRGSGG